MDPGEGPRGGRASPLFLDQNEARRAEKNFFCDRPPPPLIWRSGSATDMTGLILIHPSEIKHLVVLDFFRALYWNST